MVFCSSAARVDEASAKAFQERWTKIVPEIKLDVVTSPYRALLPPLQSYLDDVDRDDTRRPITVVLAEFVRYYNQERPHRTRGLQTPQLKERPSTGIVRSRQVLNGLHHIYERAA